MKSRYRTWLAVPPEETEAVKNAVPPLNGRKAVAWDPEKKALVCPGGYRTFTAGALVTPATGTVDGCRRSGH